MAVIRQQNCDTCPSKDFVERFVLRQQRVQSRRMRPTWVNFSFYQQKFASQIIGLRVCLKFSDNCVNCGVNICVEFCLSKPEFKIVRWSDDMYSIKSFDGFVRSGFIKYFGNCWQRIEGFPYCGV